MPACPSVSAAAIPAGKGTYALLLRVARPRRVRVGRLGVIDFPAGLYAYVGSAFGPGGLRARVGRHLKRAARPHWHIDYLRRAARVEEARFVAGRRAECEWAGTMAGDAAFAPVPGFGCSDCGCAAHLFRCAAAASFRRAFACRRPKRGRRQPASGGPTGCLILTAWSKVRRSAVHPEGWGAAGIAGRRLAAALDCTGAGERTGVSV